MAGLPVLTASHMVCVCVCCPAVPCILIDFAQHDSDNGPAPVLGQLTSSEHTMIVDTVLSAVEVTQGGGCHFDTFLVDAAVTLGADLQVTVIEAVLTLVQFALMLIIAWAVDVKFWTMGRRGGKSPATVAPDAIVVSAARQCGATTLSHSTLLRHCPCQSQTPTLQQGQRKSSSRSLVATVTGWRVLIRRA
jgi:hypothetical protein